MANTAPLMWLIRGLHMAGGGCLVYMFVPQLRLYKGRSVARGCGAAGGGLGGDLDHPYVSTKAVSMTFLLNNTICHRDVSLLVHFTFSDGGKRCS